MYYQGPRDFLARCGELFAGYLAGTFTSAVALMCFEVARDGLARFDAIAVGVITLVTFVLELVVVFLPLLSFALVAEFFGIRTILYYALAWGLIGYYAAETGNTMPPLDWFQHHTGFIFFMSGIPGGAAYWFFAGRLTRRKDQLPEG